MALKVRHHYCNLDEVASQFCTFDWNGKKLKAGPGDHYRQINGR